MNANMDNFLGGELASPSYVMATDATNFFASLLHNGATEPRAKGIKMTGPRRPSVLSTLPARRVRIAVRGTL